MYGHLSVRANAINGAVVPARCRCVEGGAKNKYGRKTDDLCGVQHCAILLFGWAHS
jgi:hypothetical protein